MMLNTFYLQMNQRKPKWDRLNDQQRKQAIDGLIAWYKAERGEDIGYLAAEAILDAVLEIVSDKVYARGVRDARKILEENLENLKIDMEVLEYEK